MTGSSILLVHGEALPQGVDHIELEALLLAEKLSVCSHSEAELAALLARNDVGDDKTPAVVLFAPSVANALLLARSTRRCWENAELIFVQPAGSVGDFRQSLGLAPMLGAYWSVEAFEPRNLAKQVVQAVANLRRRDRFRTTLARANSSLQERTGLPQVQRHNIADYYLANFIDFAQDAIVGVDLQHRILFWSAGAEELFGVDKKDAVGLDVRSMPFWTSELSLAADSVAAKSKSELVEQFRLIDDRELALETLCSGVRDAEGMLLGLSLMIRDVTAQKLLHERLKRSEEHLEALVEERTRELEHSQRALHQSQKLEAIGKLTGGVAHDFNNVLQIIGANLQLLRNAVVTEERLTRRLDSALAAVDRGAKLSSQLLAFARRQPLSPAPTNLARQLRGMDEILRRALGEEIEIETVIAGGLWTTLTDPHQLENVILNLAINARDAMREGGKLTLELSNAMLDEEYTRLVSDVQPGQYVLLAVSDTGMGMSGETLERAFEPFFTTKPEGQGTGLGLSMAYGFAKQSQGHIRIYSELGSGTTIKLYLPRSLQNEVEPLPPLVGAVVGGDETILVVEDDPAVQAAVVDQLTELGYRVLRANDAQSALSILVSGLHIDMLFTDVVMPGQLRSPELARRAKELLPDIVVLFTSGYTQNAIVHGGRLDPGVELISKPYRREDLARKIRHLLAGKLVEVKPLGEG